MNRRLKQLVQWMRDEDISATFITSTENVFYLSGFHSDPHERLLGLAVFQDAEPFLICPAMEVEDAKKSGWKYEIIGYSDIDHPWELVQQSVEKRTSEINAWAIEKEHLNVERYEEFLARYGKSRFYTAEEKLRKLRMIKDAHEMKEIRIACELADFAMEVGVNEIAEGKTELDIVAAIEYEVKKKGASMSFATTVLAGKNAASPHGVPGLTSIQKGNFVLFDLGVLYKGYCSDITRTVAFGDINAEQQRIYETVLQAQEAAVNAVRPGIMAKELDLTARRIITDAGYGSYFTHRLGHGLGISVHEYPSITEENELEMQEGMVFTIEPGIYVPEVAGVRIEDDIYVTKAGGEILNRFPKTLQFIS
ncbi:M24 family metallopeptidase [Bacillus chungangensis]|uniref:Xaa-Pro dipeptidase n=1 Tax=Bacillus chungangensis TaxID=587633 RepID=A0ABT9WMQ9_9BACI|nr:Xaa-Pro peptidase family protein [Bacillus chungangensis]MDQ0174551.1 Xaa-Pro dipeptidase [Bacillus chungangensis]